MSSKTTSKELGEKLWEAFQAHTAKLDSQNSEVLVTRVERQWKQCSAQIFLPNNIGGCQLYQIVSACMANSTVADALISGASLRTLLNIGEEARTKLQILTTPPPVGVNLAYDIGQYCPNAGVSFSYRRVT